MRNQRRVRPRDAGCDCKQCARGPSPEHLTRDVIRTPGTAVVPGARASHEVGVRVSKLFVDDGLGGLARPFLGRVHSRDVDSGLYMIVYEDGDAEELTEDDVGAIRVA